jgi:hypothetical protein
LQNEAISLTHGSSSSQGESSGFKALTAKTPNSAPNKEARQRMDNQDLKEAFQETQLSFFERNPGNEGREGEPTHSKQVRTAKPTYLVR